jgi:hypothetical protein
MSEKPFNNGWKENLLKSSLPLEQLVAEQLERSKFQVAGEFPYIRPNEQGIKTEFSIDLHANKSNGRIQEAEGVLEVVGRNSDVNLLIECKYTHPSVQWIFSPYLFAPYVPTPFICLRSECSSPIFDGVPHLLHDDLRICRRGVALSPNSFDPNVITHALSQLYYGLPNFVIANLEPSLKVLGPSNHICICPILVTTARLHVIKTGQSLDTFFSAKSLEDITDQVDALFVTQENGPMLTQYCKDLIWESLRRKSTIKLEGTLTVTKNARDEYFTRFLSYPFIAIVVNLNALDNLLQAIELAIFSQNEGKA